MATQPQYHGSNPSAMDPIDVDVWKNRFNAALADHTHITAPAPETARPWLNGFFDCFTPIDLCAITWCLPCITFGKTYHRTNKNSNMQDYNCVNTSCLMFAGFSCFGLHWVPTMFQRADVRKRYNLQGNFVTDLATSCCCSCCSLVQQDKEAEQQEELLKQKVEKSSYQKTDAMVYQ